LLATVGTLVDIIWLANEDVPLSTKPAGAQAFTVAPVPLLGLAPAVPGVRSSRPFLGLGLGGQF
jgi:hypothetical protein